MELVAKTFYGLENVLAEEIKELGGKNIEIGNRHVKYTGNKRLLYESNLWLRTAISVLVPIKSFRFKDVEDLKRRLAKLEFHQFMNVNQTFAVRGAVNSKFFKFTQYPHLLLKDAIVDFFRDRHDRRPTVEKNKPKILFDIHISNNDCTVSVNSSGAPLFQRGYRKKTGEAPLNEAVAAGLIMLSGWDRKSNLIDVFCGSGTIVIEAALIAHGIPANISRSTYSFQNWPDYDQQMWNDVLEKAPSRPDRNLNVTITGSDKDGDVILKARENLKGVPLGKMVNFEIKDFRDQQPPQGGGVLISNPPYGKRFDEEGLSELMADFGSYMKNSLSGYDCWVLNSNMDAFKSIGLKHTERIEVYNGSLSCDFRKYTIFEGSMKDHKTNLSKVDE